MTVLHLPFLYFVISIVNFTHHNNLTKKHIYVELPTFHKLESATKHDSTIKLELAKYYKYSEMTAFISERSRSSK